MKKKFIVSLLIILCLCLSGCGKEDKKTVPKTSDTEIIDGETSESDGSDNQPTSSKTIDSTLINCENCVFAYFKDKKTFGSKVSNYTRDYSAIRDEKGYQRRRFLGLAFDSNDSIQNAYACGIEKGKAYCLAGTTDGSTFDYNMEILNQVFSKSECSYNEDHTRYTCVGETNAETRTDGYVSVHYDNNCQISGKSAEIYCY